MEAATNLENQLYTDKNGDTATIPAGFAVSQVEGENIIKDGLVIIDKNGNEFVWVPVEITEEEKQAGVTFESKYPRTQFSNNTPSSGLSTNYTEPYTGGYDGEYSEYQEMIESVTANSGFYVGRYEAGCNTQRTNDNKTTSQTVLVQKGTYVYNYVPWGNGMNNIGITTGHGTNYDGITGAVELSQKFAIENRYDTSQVVSTLIYGIQWDMMLRYVADSDHNVNDSRNWGNYNDSTGDASINSGASNMDYTTGKNEAWKAKNIYDIAGNVWEWTMEAYNPNGRVYRAGNSHNSGFDFSASTRSLDSPYISLYSISFRIALYIK